MAISAMAYCMMKRIDDPAAFADGGICATGS